MASYDVELEYISKIAPIKKKIAKLNKNHESKSLKSHKDFLAKEKQSKEKLQSLSEKAILKNQRIEKAVENKLVKFRKIDNRLKNELKEFKLAETEATALKIAEIKTTIKELEVLEQADIDVVQKKYRDNVESYVEKLDTYTSNYENNRKIHASQIKKYSKLLNDKLKEIDDLKNLLNSEINEKLAAFIEMKEEENHQSFLKLQEIEKTLNNETQKIKKNSNLKVKIIREYIDSLQKEYTERFKGYIANLEDHIEQINAAFEARKELVNKDLQINLDKLKIPEDEATENQSKNSKKTIKMKIDLFNLRASTTIKYEELILNEKVLLLENEMELLRTTLNNEITNLEKLEVFLLNDQIEIKDTGDYFKNINIATRTELNNFEFANNEYLVRHEKLKTEFIRKYTELFDAFKQSLLALNKSSIEQLTKINQEIDEINKYLDTSEPLKEIEVNKLRENIEVTEIKERYNIKYARQAYEISLLENELKKVIAIEETRINSLILENNKEITDVKNKEILDKAIEKAKLKHHKAQEIYKLRLNSTKLERHILKSNYETEALVYDLEKEITRYQVHKDNIMLSKEIHQEIKNIETEANYKIEVINKRLEEDLLKLDEQISRLVYEQDAFSANVDLAISKEKLETDKKKDIIISEIKDKIAKIDVALEREIKEPLANIQKADTIINERLARLTLNDTVFTDFIADATKPLEDEELTIKQVKTFAENNAILLEKAETYINQTYHYLEDAINFMFDLEKRTISNQIASTPEASKIRKLKKRLNRLESDNKKQLNSLKSSKNDKLLAIKKQIALDTKKLLKQKTTDIDSLKAKVIKIYNNCFTSLQKLQGNILEEIQKLYAPLTKTDKEIVENAKANALKAKKLVEKEQADLLKPLDDELALFIEKLEEKRKNNFDKFEEQIVEFKAKSQELKTIALQEVSEITTLKDQEIAIKKEQLTMIETSEEAEIVKQIELLDKRKADLEEDYKTTLIKLKEKDDEAKKIYEYENRIYTIALETAESRFNDANVKAENATFLNISANNQKIEKLKKDAEKHIQTLTRNLEAEIKTFEKKIFTTRPRLEESIGDAQKAIEIEIVAKEKRLKVLNETHEKINQSLENTLYTAFQEGYEQLIISLNYYLEKYKIIGDDYKLSIDNSNVIISENNISFANALFELGNKKHTQVKENLLQINTKIT